MNIAIVRAETDKEAALLKAEIRNYESSIDQFYIQNIRLQPPNRPIVDRAIRNLREGDVILVLDFLTLSGSIRNLLKIVTEIEKRNAYLVVVKEGFDNRTETQDSIEFVRCAKRLAKFQKDIDEDLEKSLTITKAKKPRLIDEELFVSEYEKYKKGRQTQMEFASNMNVSLPTLRNIIARKKKEGLIV